MLLPTALELKFAVWMSLITTCFVTFVLITVNSGIHEKFLYLWLRSWFIAFVLVALSILFVAPKIKKYLNEK
jgi:hypothetical protein